MINNIIKWDIYEISSKKSALEGVMLRGRIRKFALSNNINLLVENATDKENTVRFATLKEGEALIIINKIKEMIPDSEIRLEKERVQNPVLSKLKVNLEERYDL